MSGWEERLECGIHVDGKPLEQALQFKYLRCILYESGTNVAESRRKMTIGKKVAGAIRFLLNARGLQLECARVRGISCSCFVV